MLSRLMHFVRVMVFSAASIAGVFAGAFLLQYLNKNFGSNLNQFGMEVAFVLFAGAGAVIFFGIVWVIIGFGPDPAQER